MVTRDYFSLHAEFGGGAQGFRCQHCIRVVRTETGIKLHLSRVHNIKIQGVLFEREIESSASGTPQPGAQEVPASEPELSSALDGRVPQAAESCAAKG